MENMLKCKKKKKWFHDLLFTAWKMHPNTVGERKEERQKGRGNGVDTEKEGEHFFPYEKWKTLGDQVLVQGTTMTEAAHSSSDGCEQFVKKICVAKYFL